MLLPVPSLLLPLPYGCIGYAMSRLADLWPLCVCLSTQSLFHVVFFFRKVPLSPNLRAVACSSSSPTTHLSPRDDPRGSLTPLLFSLCSVDNSEYSRNGDFSPSRLESQGDSLNILGGSKLAQNAESSVGVMTYAGRYVCVDQQRVNSVFFLKRFLLSLSITFFSLDLFVDLKCWRR